MRRPFSRLCSHCTSLSLLPLRRTNLLLHAKCPVPFLTNGSVEKSEGRKNESRTISRLHMNAFPPLYGYFITQKKSCFVCVCVRVCGKGLEQSAPGESEFISEIYIAVSFPELLTLFSKRIRSTLCPKH